jgi:hypothetical protein
MTHDVIFSNKVLEQSSVTHLYISEKDWLIWNFTHLVGEVYRGMVRIEEMAKRHEDL